MEHNKYKRWAKGAYKKNGYYPDATSAWDAAIRYAIATVKKSHTSRKVINDLKQLRTRYE